MILLAFCLVLFFGAFAEFVFKKTGIPDILFLIILGFVVGPHVLQLAQPSQFAQIAPIFTTFALLFLLYDGAFNIDLASFAKGIVKSLQITLLNFIISVIIVFAIFSAFGFEFFHSLLAGFVLGGVSSAFVIPLLKQLKISGEAYSVLTLESAITDVLCIVFSLAAIEIIKLGSFSAQFVASSLFVLFAAGAGFGIIAGIVWILVTQKVFKESRHYLLTVAFLVLVYVLAEFLKGNGAIAALFFGLILRNSRPLTSMFNGIINSKDPEKPEVCAGGICVISKDEEFFYSQISFFLKTFFFVYIGILISLSDQRALLIGGMIALLLMFSRTATRLVTRAFSAFERDLASAIFARGLAAAAIAQIVIQSNVSGAQLIANVTYAAITFTIILSSLKIFIAKRESAKAQPKRVQLPKITPLR